MYGDLYVNVYYKWILNIDYFCYGWLIYRYNIKNKFKVRFVFYFVVFVGVLFKVFFFINDRFCDDVVILDIYSGRERGAVSFC